MYLCTGERGSELEMSDQRVVLYMCNTKLNVCLSVCVC